MGTRTAKRTALFVTALALAGAVVGRSSESNQSEPSPFTGQVKPVLYVEDVTESAPFYRDVLGFEFLGYADIDGEPYYAEMAAEALKFGLHNPLNEEHRSWVGHQRIYFRVNNVAEHRTFVEENGGSPGEIIETDWMDMFIVRDPSGHQIVFAETDPSRHSTDPW
jgi:predicted enzyme related to lactoylglutathione lyase